MGRNAQTPSWAFPPMARRADRWDIGAMFNAIEISGVYAAPAEALAAAMERAIAALSIGTVIALALAGLVIGVEVLANAWRQKRRGREARRSRPRAARRHRGEAYR